MALQTSGTEDNSSEIALLMICSYKPGFIIDAPLYGLGMINLRA
jgi:hypothetical protein